MFPSRRPPIFIAEHEHKRLRAAARPLAATGDVVARFLLAELEPAILCPPDGLPDDVVAMNCRATYRIDDAAAPESRFLVYPEDLAFRGGRISVLPHCQGPAVPPAAAAFRAAPRRSGTERRMRGRNVPAPRGRRYRDVFNGPRYPETRAMMTPEQPPIILSTRDYDRLISLALMAESRDPAVAAFLTEELERATLVEPEAIAPTVVTMYAHVEFLNHERRRQCVTLVYPGEEDIDEGKVSVLTPIGAALIGLSEGQSIDWTTRTGQVHRLTVLKVHAQCREERDRSG